MVIFWKGRKKDTQICIWNTCKTERHHISSKNKTVAKATTLTNNLAKCNASFFLFVLFLFLVSIFSQSKVKAGDEGWNEDDEQDAWVLGCGLAGMCWRMKGENLDYVRFDHLKLFTCGTMCLKYLLMGSGVSWLPAFVQIATWCHSLPYSLYLKRT